MLKREHKQRISRRRREPPRCSALFESQFLLIQLTLLEGPSTLNKWLSWHMALKRISHYQKIAKTPSVLPAAG